MNAFGDVPSDHPATGVGATCQLPLANLDPCPYAIRLHADEDTMERLAASIRKVGVLHPILVRRHRTPGRYEVVFGSLRVAASRRAGKADIDARVVDLSDAEAQQIALTENLDRFDLTPIEVARLVHGLIAAHGKAGAAALIDRSIRSVELAKARLTLPEAIADGILRAGLRGRHATALLRLQRWPEIQTAVYAHLARHRVTVAVCEPAIRRLVGVLEDSDATLDSALRVLQLKALPELFEVPQPASSPSLMAGHAATLARDLRRLRRSGAILAGEDPIVERLRELGQLIEALLATKPVSRGSTVDEVRELRESDMRTDPRRGHTEV